MGSSLPWEPAGSYRPRQAGDWGPGTRVAGRYTIERQIGEGASAVTYRAHDEVLGRPVALKVLRSRFARDPEVVARFEREARIAAAIVHPNVVTVYDFGTDGGAFFIALQYVAGRDLSEELEARGRLPVDEATAIVRAVLAGLGAIHLAGIVHRDIKPSNILLGLDGIARLTDFGVAYEIVADRLTSHGTTIGTAAYMAPEQARGGELTAATDLYAVGVVLFEAVTGRLPFAHDNPMATLMAQIQMPPPRPREIAPSAQIPPPIERAILRALAKDPRQRFPSAAAMSTALAEASGLTLNHAATTRLPAASMTGGARSAAAPTARMPGQAFARPSSDNRFRPASGWSRAAAVPAKKVWLRPWLVAAAIALAVMIALASMLMPGLGFGDDDGDPRTPLPVAAAPTATPSPTATEGAEDGDGGVATEENDVLPAPTRRVRPTRTPTSTVEPEPIASATTEPIETPEPTLAPTATAVPTEEPTEAPEPPTPTIEPRPTATAEPTDIPTAEVVEQSPSIRSTIGGAGSAGNAIPPAQSTADGTEFAASSWKGGQFDEASLGRPATVLDGRGSRDTQAILNFDLNAVPGNGLLLRFMLFVPESGLGQGFWVEVNRAPFGPDGGQAGANFSPGWTLIEIEVPPDLLAPGENVVAVRYETPARQGAAIGLGGGEIVPLGDSLGGNGGGLERSSSESAGDDGVENESDPAVGDEVVGEDGGGPRAAPTIAPRQER